MIIKRLENDKQLCFTVMQKLREDIHTDIAQTWLPQHDAESHLIYMAQNCVDLCNVATFEQQALQLLQSVKEGAMAEDYLAGIFSYCLELTARKSDNSDMMAYLASDYTKLGFDPSANSNAALRKAVEKGHLENVKRLLSIPSVRNDPSLNSIKLLATIKGHLAIQELIEERIPPKSSTSLLDSLRPLKRRKYTQEKE